MLRLQMQMLITLCLSAAIDDVRWADATAYEFILENQM